MESIDHWSLRPNCNFVLQNCRLWKKGTCVNNISRPGSNLLNMLLDSFAHVVCGSMHYFHGCRRRITSAIDIHWFHSEALEKVEKEFHQHQPALISVILRHPPHLVGHFCNPCGFCRGYCIHWKFPERYSLAMCLHHLFFRTIPVFISSLGEVECWSWLTYKSPHSHCQVTDFGKRIETEPQTDLIWYGGWLLKLQFMPV